jgi:putative hemolysin
MISQVRRISLILAFVCLTAAAIGCATTAEESAVTPVATGTPAPEGVLQAREAVLAFLRDGANECVPPKQARWTVEAVAEPPAGYDVYRSHSGDCIMTITVPADASEDLVYHVALGDGLSGFCWQAVVDARGQILLSGNAAQTYPALGNPAASYCVEHGYRFEIVNLETGQQCGMCVFDNGRMCNGWAFFHGICTPENAPAVEPAGL